MNLPTKFEEAVLNQYFSGMRFVDQRERGVFLSYVRGFSILFFDSAVRNIVEIGGGQSTAIFALMAERFGCRVSAIDMNPEAIKNKVRSAELCDRIFRNVSFQRGVSISRKELDSYYQASRDHIGDISIDDVFRAAGQFIDTSMDGRKESQVLSALNIPRLDVSLLRTVVMNNDKFSRSLLDIYRNDDDEFVTSSRTVAGVGLLDDILGRGDVDAVFLDSGEFSSLPEWEIVSRRLRVGGYVILHDIFFPKSFKNWLVCASIRANPKWDIVYVDRSTPQGLMVARREI